MKESLSHIGKEATKVSFQDCLFKDQGFYEIVSCFPKAEKLSLISIGKFIDIACEQMLEPQMFPKLKQLKLEFVTSVSEFA